MRRQARRAEARAGDRRAPLTLHAARSADSPRRCSTCTRSSTSSAPARRPISRRSASAARHSEREGISRLMGTWKVIGSTHRWPRVVNLWEMDGWEHWAEALERQFLPGKVDRGTGAVVGEGDRMAQRRLRSHPRADADTARRATRCAPPACGRGSACTRSCRLLPGKCDGVPRSRRRNAAAACSTARGLTLMGAYGAAMRSDEALAHVGGARLPAPLPSLRGAAVATPN